MDLAKNNRGKKNIFMCFRPLGLNAGRSRKGALSKSLSDNDLVAFSENDAASNCLGRKEKPRRRLSRVLKAVLFDASLVSLYRYFASLYVLQLTNIRCFWSFFLKMLIVVIVIWIDWCKLISIFCHLVLIIILFRLTWISVNLMLFVSLSLNLILLVLHNLFFIWEIWHARDSVYSSKLELITLFIV